MAHSDPCRGRLEGKGEGAWTLEPVLEQGALP